MEAFDDSTEVKVISVGATRFRDTNEKIAGQTATRCGELPEQDSGNKDYQNVRQPPPLTI